MADMIKTLAERHIAPALKAGGFKRSRLKWRRGFDHLSHIIEIQSSRWNDEAVSSFTLNVGVVVHALADALWETRTASHACFPCFRIGYLPGVDFGRDIWWTLHDEMEIDQVGKEVSGIIDAHCLPLLDGCFTIDAALALAGSEARWKLPQEHAAFGLLLRLAGQREQGDDVLARLVARLPRWREPIETAQQRLASDGGARH